MDAAWREDVDCPCPNLTLPVAGGAADRMDWTNCTLVYNMYKSVQQYVMYSTDVFIMKLVKFFGNV